MPLRQKWENLKIKSEENIKLTEEKKEEKKEAKSGVSRRGFIQGTVAGVVVGAAATYGATQMMQPPTAPLVAPPAVEEEAAPFRRQVTMNINDNPITMQVQSNWTLLHVLRDHLKLKGTKITCDYGECGACTVIINGHSALACMILAIEQDGNDITTIEGLPKVGKLHPIQQAFIDRHAYSCGYCIPGMIMSAKALLDKNPRPTEDEIREGISGNMCRCTGYVGPVRAIKTAAGVT